MKRKHPFYLIKRPTKRGKIYYVVYDHDPSKPKTIGVLVNKSDRKKSWEPVGFSDAVVWAYANMDNICNNSSITFRQFAGDFFNPDKCTWTRRMLKKGKTFHGNYLLAHKGRLKNYILPRFGPVHLNMSTTKMILKWLMDVESIFN